jgi:glutaredoxin
MLVGCSTKASDMSANSYEAQLAQHLAESGATMYGAYWCPHCAEQKEAFNEAIDQVPYVECDPSGENAQPQLCIDKGIQGYPTWEIDGQIYPGTRPLDDLAQLSGFSPAGVEPE